MLLLHRQRDPFGLVIRPTVVVTMVYLLAAECYWIYWMAAGRFPNGHGTEPYDMVVSEDQFWTSTLIHAVLAAALLFDALLVSRSGSRSRGPWLVGIGLALLGPAILQYALIVSTTTLPARLS